MTFSKNSASEDFLSETSQTSITPSIDFEMFQDTSLSFLSPGPGHSFNTFTSGPFASAALSPNNYFSPLLPVITQPQQTATATYVGGNFTRGAPVNGTITPNAAGMNHWNSPFIYQTETSQLSRRVPTEPDLGIVQEFDAVIYPTKPSQLLRKASTTAYAHSGIAQEFHDDTIHPTIPTRSTTKQEDEPIRCKWEGCIYIGTFERTAELKRHVESIHIHINPKAYVCPFYPCDKTFGRKDKFHEHERSHFKNNRAW